MPNPFDELDDLDDAFAAIDEDVERRIDDERPMMVGRWPKKVGEDTHDLFADPDPTDEDERR